MLQESIIRCLLYELDEISQYVDPDLNQALYHEIWLQKAVLYGELAIAQHGRKTIISNLNQLIEDPSSISDLILKRRFLSVVAKELQILELSKNIEWR
jgi:hypothetical protein